MPYIKKGVDAVVENLEKDNQKTFDNPCTHKPFGKLMLGQANHTAEVILSTIETCMYRKRICSFKTRKQRVIQEGMAVDLSC